MRGVIVALRSLSLPKHGLLDGHTEELGNALVALWSRPFVDYWEYLRTRNTTRKTQLELAKKLRFLLLFANNIRNDVAASAEDRVQRLAKLLVSLTVELFVLQVSN